MKHPIAIELLEIEHDRLMRDHYDAAPTASFKWTCDGCIRARDVKQELDAATSRPLVVLCMDGGLIQETLTAPGLGTPEVVELDFDRGDEPREDTVEFLERVAEVEKALRPRGLNLDTWEDEIAKLREWAGERNTFDAVKDWPVDHAEGKE